MDPNGKVALVTGGARIGQAVSLSLARHGCGLALPWRSSPEAAETAAESARRLGVSARTYQVDARDEAQIGATVERVVLDFGRFDILINMASTYSHTPLQSLGATDWSEALDANARSAFQVSLKAAPH